MYDLFEFIVHETSLETGAKHMFRGLIKMSGRVNRSIKRDLPGDATAPLNYSRDFKAFKDYQILPSVKAKKAALDGLHLIFPRVNHFSILLKNISSPNILVHVFIPFLSFLRYLPYYLSETNWDSTTTVRSAKYDRAPSRVLSRVCLSPDLR